MYFFIEYYEHFKRGSTLHILDCDDIKEMLTDQYSAEKKQVTEKQKDDYYDSITTEKIYTLYENCELGSLDLIDVPKSDNNNSQVVLVYSNEDSAIFDHDVIWETNASEIDLCDYYKLFNNHGPFHVTHYSVSGEEGFYQTLSSEDQEICQNIKEKLGDSLIKSVSDCHILAVVHIYKGKIAKYLKIKPVF